MLPSCYGLFLWNCKPEQTFLHKLPLVAVSYCNDRKVTDAPGEDTVVGGAEFVRTLTGKRHFTLTYTMHRDQWIIGLHLKDKKKNI